MFQKLLDQPNLIFLISAISIPTILFLLLSMTSRFSNDREKKSNFLKYYDKYLNSLLIGR